MKMSRTMAAIFLAAPLIGLSGCKMASSGQLLKTNQSQVQTRAIQTRAFETSDTNRALRASLR